MVQGQRSWGPCRPDRNPGTCSHILDNCFCFLLWLACSVGKSLLSVRAGHQSPVEGHAPCRAGRPVLKEHYPIGVQSLPISRVETLPPWLTLRYQQLNNWLPELNSQLLEAVRSWAQHATCSTLAFPGGSVPTSEGRAACWTWAQRVSEGPMVPVSC